MKYSKTVRAYLERNRNYTTDESRKNASIALKNRLYVSGWCLSGQLKLIRSGFMAGTVVIKYIDGIPVGTALLGSSPCRNSISVFVRKSYRRQGIGTELIKMLSRESGVPTDNMIFFSGIKESDIFFHRTMDKIKEIS